MLIDFLGMSDFSIPFFFQDKYVDIDTFVKGCMRMKGPATSIDMLSMGSLVSAQFKPWGKPW